MARQFIRRTSGLIVPAAGGSFSITPSSTQASTSNTNTAAAGAISWANGANIVLVGIFWGSALSATINSATLDGSQTLTPVSGAFCNNLVNGNAAQIFSISNPTGSGGTPTFNFSTALNAGWGIRVWSIGTTQSAPSSGNNSGATSFAANANASITIPVGGGAVGIVGDQDTIALAFTNLTTDNGSISYPGQFGSNLIGSGNATGGTGSSVSVTGAGAGSSGPYAMALAAIAP